LAWHTLAYMSERSPFSILTFDTFQNEFIDESLSGTFATQTEAQFEADGLLVELRPESDTSEESDPTYMLYLVGPEGERTFYTKG
jgi:hypothetical protein